MPEWISSCSVCSWFCGGHGPGETPGPFPNPEAKAWHGDGTALERVWESSTPPHSTLGVPVEQHAPGTPFFVCYLFDASLPAGLFVRGSSVLSFGRLPPVAPFLSSVPVNPFLSRSHSHGAYGSGKPLFCLLVVPIAFIVPVLFPFPAGRDARNTFCPFACRLACSRLLSGPERMSHHRRSRPRHTASHTCSIRGGGSRDYPRENVHSPLPAKRQGVKERNVNMKLTGG